MKTALAFLSHLAIKCLPFKIDLGGTGLGAGVGFIAAALLGAGFDFNPIKALAFMVIGGMAGAGIGGYLNKDGLFRPPAPLTPAKPQSLPAIIKDRIVSIKPADPVTLAAAGEQFHRESRESRDHRPVNDIQTVKLALPAQRIV